MTTDDADDEQPISAMPKGMLISEDEYKLVSDGLGALADQAAKNDRKDIAAALKRFVIRMRHHTYAGTGVDQPTLERFSKAIESGFAAGDYEAARRSIAGLLVAVIRMDPDPAVYVALQLAPTLVHLTVQAAAQSQLALVARSLRDFAKFLESERKAFEEKGWSTPAPKVIDYIKDLLAFCAAEIQAGQDPYAAEKPDETH
jgi:hypothetical protein